MEGRWRSDGSVAPPPNWRPVMTESQLKRQQVEDDWARRHARLATPSAPLDGPSSSSAAPPRRNDSEDSPESGDQAPTPASGSRASGTSGNAASTPTVYIDPAHRAEIEAFAKRLEHMGGADRATPEILAYSRLDLSAMLVYMANGREGLLKELQSAVLRRDMDSFILAMDKGGIGTRQDVADMRWAAARQNREVIIEVLNRVGKPQGKDVRRTHGPESVGKEVAGRFDPMLGTERRAKVTSYLSGNPKYPVNFRRSPGCTSQGPIVYSLIELGDDSWEWEKECQIHPYVLVGANATSDLGLEARGDITFDGRLNGQTGGGWNFGN